MAVRDALILGLTLLSWQSLAREIETGAAPLWLSIASGAGAGVCAFLLHEWGHLAGARMRGARIEAARSLASPFLFSFDSQTNDARQFLTMSFAGFAATGIFLLIFWLGLPLDWLAGRIAMGIALFLASLTVLLEFPLVFQVLRGKGLPSVEVFR